MNHSFFKVLKSEVSTACLSPLFQQLFNEIFFKGTESYLWPVDWFHKNLLRPAGPWSFSSLKQHFEIIVFFTFTAAFSPDRNENTKPEMVLKVTRSQENESKNLEWRVRVLIAMSISSSIFKSKTFHIFKTLLLYKSWNPFYAAYVT